MIVSCIDFRHWGLPVGLEIGREMFEVSILCWHITVFMRRRPNKKL